MAGQVENNEKILSPKGKENYSKLLEYLSDPDNDWPCRRKYSQQILGYKLDNQVYKTLTTQQLTEIEDLALDNRKVRSARQRAMVRQALFKRAMGFTCKDTKLFKTSDDKIISQKIDKVYPPDAVAAREFLDRVEGKVKETHEVLNKYESLADDEIDDQINALIASNPKLLEKFMEFAVTNKGGNE